MTRPDPTSPKIPRPGEDPTIALVLGWLIPGGGHWYLGHRRKAVFFFGVLMLTFLAGYAMADFRNVSVERHKWYFLGQSFLGLPTVVAAVTTAYLPPLNRPIPGEDLGTLYTCVAALLNALLFLDAWERAERKRLGIEPKPANAPKADSPKADTPKADSPETAATAGKSDPRVQS